MMRLASFLGGSQMKKRVVAKYIVQLYIYLSIAVADVYTHMTDLVP